MQDTIIHTVYAVVVSVSIAFIVVIVARRIDKFFRKPIEKREFAESILEGAIEEPRPVRDLSLEERVHLEKGFRLSKLLASSIKIWLIVFVLVFVFISVLLFDGLSQNTLDEISLVSEYLNRGYYLYASTFSSVVVIMMVFYSSRCESRLYKDTRLPVLRVQGEFIKRYDQKDKKTKKIYSVTFVVRGIEFTVENDLLDIVLLLYKKDEIEVEYSPFSKRVWAIRKLSTNS